MSIPGDWVSGVASAVWWETLTDAHGSLAKAGDILLAEAGAFQGPSLVDHVQEVLPVGAYRLAFVGYYNGGVVVLRRGWPPVRDVDLLRETDNDVAVVFERSRACPE